MMHVGDAKTGEQLEADVARMEAELARRDAQLAELQEARDAQLAELNATRAELRKLALCMVSPSQSTTPSHDHPSQASEDTKNGGGDDGVSEYSGAATTDGTTDDRMVSRTAAAAPTPHPRLALDLGRAAEAVARVFASFADLAAVVAETNQPPDSKTADDFVDRGFNQWVYVKEEKRHRDRDRDERER